MFAVSTYFPKYSWKYTREGKAGRCKIGYLKNWEGKAWLEVDKCKSKFDEVLASAVAGTTRGNWFRFRLPGNRDRQPWINVAGVHLKSGGGVEKTKTQQLGAVFKEFHKMGGRSIVIGDMNWYSTSATPISMNDVSSSSSFTDAAKKLGKTFDTYPSGEPKHKEATRLDRCFYRGGLKPLEIKRIGSELPGAKKLSGKKNKKGELLGNLPRYSYISDHYGILVKFLIE